MPVYTLVLVSADGREVVRHDSGVRALKPGYEILVRGQWWQLVGSPLRPEAESETFVCSPAPPGEGVAQAG